MKGKVWADHKHKLKYPAWAEIKTDEIRCHVIVCPQTWGVTFLSYAEKPLANMAEFAAMWAALARHTAVYEFDTGFEANGNFNDSYRWVRSTNGLPPELVSAPTKFFLFDLPTHLSHDFIERKAWRSRIVAEAEHLGYAGRIVTPVGELMHSEEDVDAYFTEVREDGHEGLMVKTLSHTYQRGKRIDGWLKMKPENDADGIITQLIRAVSIEGVPLDRIGSVQLRVPGEDGAPDSYAAPHGIPHKLGADMFWYPEKYLGQWVDFKFMERDRQNGYRHPTFKRLREAKA